MTDYLFIDYQMWGNILDGLVNQIKKLREKTDVYRFTHVYSPPRGGLPIAVHLSHHLKIEFIMDLDLYLDHELEKIHNLLVIDDVVHTGKTFKTIKRTLDEITDIIPTFQYKLASIHYKPMTVIKPEIYMQEVPDDTWIVYPFETCEDCEYERMDFENRRKKELVMKTGSPIITATQGQDLINSENQIIWQSFLGEHE